MLWLNWEPRECPCSVSNFVFNHVLRRWVPCQNWKRLGMWICAYIPYRDLPEPFFIVNCQAIECLACAFMLCACAACFGFIFQFFPYWGSKKKERLNWRSLNKKASTTNMCNGTRTTRGGNNWGSLASSDNVWMLKLATMLKLDKLPAMMLNNFGNL